MDKFNGIMKLVTSAAISFFIYQTFFRKKQVPLVSEENKNKPIPLPDYPLDGEPKTMEELEKVFKTYRLEKYFETIKSIVRPKIVLNLIPTDETVINSAQSKIGGQPDLTEQMEWPKDLHGKSLSFVGQINLEEASSYDQSGLLPQQGLLSFFYCVDQEAWGFDAKDRQQFRVFYHADTKNLARQNFPTDLKNSDAIAIFKPNLITFSSSLSIPTSWEEDSIDGLILDEDSDNYINASRASDNQMLGYANCVQGTMELECQLVTNGLYCGDPSGYKDPRAKELEPGKKEWVLLFQIDSEEDKAGMMWGDSGRLYFWIKKQDLINKDFDKAWCILQCY